jgi:hypothetical protein
LLWRWLCQSCIDICSQVLRKTGCAGNFVWGAWKTLSLGRNLKPRLKHKA